MICALRMIWIKICPCKTLTKIRRNPRDWQRLPTIYSQYKMIKKGGLRYEYNYKRKRILWHYL